MTQLSAPDFRERETLEAFLAEVGESGFIEAHRAIAERAARSVWSTAVEGQGGLQEDDLINFALFEVVWQHRDEWSDSAGGQSWHTFLYARMRWRMLDLIRVTSRDSRVNLSRLNKWREAFTSLQFSLGRAPTVEEVCESIGMSVEDYSEHSLDDRSRRWIQLENRRPRNDESTDAGQFRLSWADLDSRSFAHDPFAQSALMDIVRLVLRGAGLHWDRVALFAYYFLGLSMKETGTLIGTSESRVSQGMSSIVSGLNRRTLAMELFGRELNLAASDTAGTYLTCMQELWEALRLSQQQQIVEEFNLCSFARRQPEAERDSRRRLTIPLPPGFRPELPKIHRSSDRTLCVLVKNTPRSGE